MAEREVVEQVASAVDRRTMLRGVAAAGAVCACGLTACASSGSSNPGSGSGSSGSSSSSSSSSGSTGSSGSGGSTGGSGAAIATTSEIPVDGGKIFASHSIVVTQPAAGTFKGFDSTCTHMGCTVGSISDGLIHCPCHGSAFHITDGSVANGPATQPLGTVKITVQGNQIIPS